MYGKFSPKIIQLKVLALRNGEKIPEYVTGILREERKRGILLDTAVITPDRIKLGEYFLIRKLKSYGRTYVPYSLIQERLNIV